MNCVFPLNDSGPAVKDDGEVCVVDSCHRVFPDKPQLEAFTMMRCQQAFLRGTESLEKELGQSPAKRNFKTLVQTIEIQP